MFRTNTSNSSLKHEKSSKIKYKTFSESEDEENPNPKPKTSKKEKANKEKTDVVALALSLSSEEKKSEKMKHVKDNKTMIIDSNDFLTLSLLGDVTLFNFDNFILNVEKLSENFSPSPSDNFVENFFTFRTQVRLCFFSF